MTLALNAARALAARLPRTALARLVPEGDAARELAATLGDGALVAAVARRFELDLAGLLNRLRVAELDDLAAALRVTDERPAARITDDRAVAAAAAPRDAAALRTALWRWGAIAEAGGDARLGTALQPVPIAIGARLCHPAPPRGLAPSTPAWPRPLPPPRPPEPPPEEPDDVDALLAAADRALGVRLPPRGRDKGAWGNAAARLLGVVEHGHDEPDWRGDVELKTVPVARDRAGAWRVTEDPAVAMVSAAPLGKLRRVLWMVRATIPAVASAAGDPDASDDTDARAADPGATFLSWYLVEWDAEIARLVRRDLHTRPKGPRGSTARGWYLHKRFFVDAGLYATLNGPAA